MKLISMTDFVLEFENNFPRQFGEAYSEYNESKSEYLNMKLKSYENYAQFLKQPLTLGMFVPCDEDGSGLQKPINYDVWNLIIW